MPSLITDKLWQRPFYNPWVFLSTVLPRLVFNHLIVHIYCVCTPDCEIISDKTEPERLSASASNIYAKLGTDKVGGDPHLKSNKNFFPPSSNISNHSIKSQLKAFITFLHILCRFPRRLHPKYGRYSIFKCIPRGPDCISCSLNARCHRGRNGAVLPFLYLGSKVRRIVPLAEYFSARRGDKQLRENAKFIPPSPFRPLLYLRWVGEGNGSRITQD